MAFINFLRIILLYPCHNALLIKLRLIIVYEEIICLLYLLVDNQMPSPLQFWSRDLQRDFDLERAFD